MGMRGNTKFSIHPPMRTPNALVLDVIQDVAVGAIFCLAKVVTVHCMFTGALFR